MNQRKDQEPEGRNVLGVISILVNIVDVLDMRDVITRTECVHERSIIVV